MEFLFDTANLQEIQEYSEYFPITGVTSNPSIIKAENPRHFFKHLKKIREVIGFNKTLHVQINAGKYDNILEEAYALRNKIDEQVYIKIPTTEQGLKAMMKLKAEGINITATAIYSKIQGFMAIAAGADYLAPYYNRMENLDIDSFEVISAFRKMIDENNSSTKIVAASFKNIAQINKAFMAGAHAVTAPPFLFHEAFEAAPLKKAVTDFNADWFLTYGSAEITHDWDYFEMNHEEERRRE